MVPTWIEGQARPFARAHLNPVAAPQRQYTCSFYFERKARKQGFRVIAGADEAGRGCLFGAVYAAAAVLDPDKQIRGLNDSKQLDAESRERLDAEIRLKATAFAVAAAGVAEIERLNIYQASRLATRRALLALNVTPDYLLLDYLRVDMAVEQLPLVKGDARSRSIAAASILAKVARDKAMREWDKIYPQYGLAKHKGYGTPEHLAALAEFGPTPQHRMGYQPVAAVSPEARLRRGQTPAQISLFEETYT